LPECGVAGECIEDLFESLCGDVVTLDLQNFDLAVVGDEFGEFSGSVVSDEAIVEDHSCAVSEILELASKAHILNIKNIVISARK
jgi:hypothetical protein